MMKRLWMATVLLTSTLLGAQERVNETWSPDSSRVAFTRDNNLWVADAASGKETQLTFDGSEVVLNGYASWVYYEEIFGRPSRYRAFWWSPDSEKIAFYRFDNTDVPVFPIYSPFAEDHDRSGMKLVYSQNAGAAMPLEGVSPTGGSVRMTRYPKCGDPNPKVRIGIVRLAPCVAVVPAVLPDNASAVLRAGEGSVVWADFDEHEDQYFGTPFWGADSRAFFVQREPRTQNALDLYAVSPSDGSRRRIYHETYPTWLDWIEGMQFGEKGLYMVRAFETGWQQIYYLSYDGGTFRRLTDGENWRASILKVEEGKAVKSGKFDGSQATVYFTAERDACHVRTGLYKASGGKISALSDPAFSVSDVRFAADGGSCSALLSNLQTPPQEWTFDLRKPSRSRKIRDTAPEDFDPAHRALPQLVTMTTRDGLVLPGYIVYPKDFDPSQKYPVHMDIYGGPDAPMVRDRFLGDDPFDWWAEHGIIQIVADCRAAGHNGRAGLDRIYRRLGEVEVQDFVEWASWLKALPYVDGDKIGVEGFSFGGTMAALLVMDHSDAFHYGIAGGGVYDWALYDTHYTERFMDTPVRNPDGYARTRAASHAKNYPVSVRPDALSGDAAGSVMLRLTHGTGDDNVHFQSTLLLVDALQKEGKQFELMIYPDGMHGYRGYQGAHSDADNQAFWLRCLL